MKVAFISPGYPPEQIDFTRGLAEVGAAVIGIGDGPIEGQPERVRRHLSDYIRVPHLFSEEKAAVTITQRLEPLRPDRVETNWEPCVLLAAKVRDNLGLGGMSRDTCLGFRDKQVMKERVANAGLRVPRSIRVRTTEESHAGAERIGYPLIIKPIAGAGSADTYRCENHAEFEQALERMGHVQEASVEEFVDGEEFTYDTVCIDGVPAFENVAQYHPRPLVFRSEQWISPAQIVYRDPGRQALRGGIELGRGVLKALGMGTGFTHMEWYKKPDGEVVFGEVACRNGGGHFVDMMNWSNDFDVYRGWAQAVCWGRFEVHAHRRYHVGMVFKRALGEGRIARIEGIERVREICGRHIVADNLLPIGAHRRDWKQTLISDGYVALRHPDEATTRAMMDLVVRDVRMFAR